MHDDLTLVRAGVPANDDCPVLTRINAFIVDQGVKATLEHSFRARDGRARDLSRYVPGAIMDASDSLSVGAPATPDGKVMLRVKEYVSTGGPETNPIWEIEGYARDPAAGVVRATLEAGVVESPGIYELGWGILASNGDVVATSQALLSVERSLFPASAQTLRQQGGTMTIQEIRLSLADDPASNLLLDDVEFSDAQILQAIAWPVQTWNEALPPISPFTTKTFPYRGAWLSAVSGRLHIMAAAHYRRNVLRNAAAGIQQSDKDKEREYLAEGQRLLDEYNRWVASKKMSLNMKGFVGNHRSSYIVRSGW